MRIFQNIQDRQALEAAEEQNFVDDCKDQFIEKSIAATNSKKVKLLSLVSYLPNILSATTAGFFVLFLLSGYSTTVGIILGALLLTIVVAVEAGKRLLINGTAHSYLIARKVAAGSLVALVLLMGISMGASYQGGKALVIETAAPPPRLHNSQIDSLATLLAAELATIDRLQRTTWKGKITSDAVKGINAAKKVQSTLVDRIAALEAQDDATHGEALQKHTSKHVNFGIILGVLAALADVFLLGMLWTAQRLKYQVAAVHVKGNAVASQAAQDADTQSKLEALEAALKAARDAAADAQAAAAQARQGNPYAATPPHVYNHAEPQRRGIGFTANENRNTKIVNENRISDGNRICEHCGTAYQYRHHKQKYCSDTCRIAAWETRTGRTYSKTGKV